MNRFKNNAFLVILFALMLVFIGCEGPAGSDGTDGADGNDGVAGTDGVDGNVTCLVCHSDENLAMKQHEFNASQHSSGDIAVSYAGGRSYCYPCHSHEQFVAHSAGLPPHNIANPSAWKCSTCHNLHTTFEYEDYALRTTDAAAIWNGGDFLLKGESMFKINGNSNLCANCHQSRRAEPNMTNPGATFEITSTHYGPHHGAQTNVLVGEGFAEIPGTLAYPTAGSAAHMTPSCVGCHMTMGDHSFEPSLDGCTDCHTSITTFDHNGSQTEIHDLLVELRDLLVAAGVIEQEEEELYELNPETGEIELVLHTGGYHPIKGTYDMILAQAFFNWVGLEEDRSMGVHNPDYVKALLKNSIDAVNAL
jgi:uncharacterized CHY-type Zn-finger protein